ncbi:MAG: RluA family pseudouridine synthase [Alphaproteobacteria bacterium]|nr:RluA family pseudouridine synthase [Alphaproteobacteria bacterium]MBV8547840.1 RluA family pseudouridine synthase [Alphaproteobacteria bacterium]
MVSTGSNKIPVRQVTDDEAGVRLDRWFKRHYPSLTHGQLQKILRKGEVRVDGKRADAAQRLEAGQGIRIPPQVTEEPNPVQLQKRDDRAANDLKKMILFQDDDVLVLNKPAGLAVQGGTGLKTSLDAMLASLATEKGGKPKLVHRLDRDTSGVLLVARNVFAANKLAEAFRDRATQKIYWAITIGVPEIWQGKINAPLVKQGEKMVIAGKRDDDAKSAVTLYQVVESATGQAAFVALWPVTGRTHQLRVHMQYAGNPLLGDRLYAGVADTLPMKELGKGLHLHARRLIIPHPRRGRIDVTAPLGTEMRKTWKWFGFDDSAKVDFEDAV